MSGKSASLSHFDKNKYGETKSGVLLLAELPQKT